MSATPHWDPAELTHPGRLLTTAVTFLVAAFAAQTTSCNVHEVGHAVVGTMVGWEVERINLCLPAGGSVEYSDIPRWAGNVQGYAGPLVGAGYLLAIYIWGIARPRRPLRSPMWWAAGLGVVAFIGPQFVLAALEGSAGPGEDYTELFRDLPQVFVPLVLLSGIGGMSAYVWRWREVWRSPAPPSSAGPPSSSPSMSPNR